MHKPKSGFVKGTIVIDDNNDIAIILDDCIESPIRLLRKENGIVSSFATTLEEADLEVWKKLIIIKRNSGFP